MALSLQKGNVEASVVVDANTGVRFANFFANDPILGRQRYFERHQGRTRRVLVTLARHFAATRKLFATRDLHLYAEGRCGLD